MLLCICYRGRKTDSRGIVQVRLEGCGCFFGLAAC